jgi:uncharacterized protein YjbI with pentapeptide repeats
MSASSAELLQWFSKRGRPVWNLTLEAADLRGIELAGLRANRLALSHADLRDSRLRQIRFTECELQDVALDGADCVGAVLRLCDLDGVRLLDGELRRARIENCTARGARLAGADLTEAFLTDTDFSRASFRNANLTGVSASGASFRGADLTGACLVGASLIDADLRGADLTGADLDGIDLRGADLRGVVGDHPLLAERQDAMSGLPPEMRALAATVAPVVGEVLRSAGKQGWIDGETAERLQAEAAAYSRTSAGRAPSADTLAAVGRIMEQLGGDALPVLFGALQQPADKEPPPAVKAMISGLRGQLGLDETASAEDVLARLLGRNGG